jgi:hypothetical protein
MSRQSVGWYVRRLRRMSATELAWRVRDHARRSTWSSKQIKPGRIPSGRPRLVAADRSFTAVLPGGVATSVPEQARKAVIATADGILDGHLEVLGVQRTDLRAPDWFADPVTGRRSDPAQYAFRINHRSEEQTGNVKQVWELSRHHHLTQLAAAWYLTGDDAYADRVAEHLNSWWRDNPYLSGVHWTNGIEVGIRLISWTWIRRLLNDWPGVAALFDDNDLALRQICWHQCYLAAFRSRGSSANNHVIAEAAGQLVASCAFPWFPQSARWRTDAAVLLQRALEDNTFPSGINRELATDYHRFVSELGLLAAIEADAAGHPLGPRIWGLLTRTLDAAAAIVDETCRPPRQGDDDEGRVLVIDPPDAHHWSAFLSLGAAIAGRTPWWPQTQPDTVSVLAGALSGDRRIATGRASRRPSHFADAGLTLLRTGDEAPEIWCRCDGGPHGFLSIAAHAHADALSLEVRVGGVDVLADPGTYSYHGEHRWRDYFRSTIGHNTLEVAGRDQSSSGGPFLWTSQATGQVTGVDADDRAPVASWSGRHDGYDIGEHPVVHHRAAVLDRSARTLRVEDRLDGAAGHDVRLAYHLGPQIRVELTGNVAVLRWETADGTMTTVAELPPALDWSAHSGETEPVLGWYSARFGQKVPATTLVGSGRLEPATTLVSSFRFPS